MELRLPAGAELTRVIQEPEARYLMPVGAWADGALPTRAVEGRLLQRAWRIDSPELSPQQVQSALRDQLESAGFTTRFDCAARACGGFDFRFNTRVMPAPDMFVDLNDFRFLSASRESGGAAGTHVTSLVSRTGESVYVQIIVIAPEGAARADVTTEPVTSISPEPQQTGGQQTSIARALVEHGHVVLPDLEFGSGSAALAEGSYASLQALAEFLKADERRRVALVGHTDTVGGLEANVALSRRRAASVLERMVERYDVPRAQLESNGMGYLSPIAPNTTQEGRDANRRVEAVLLNTE